jgi:hypothetical protein
MEPKINLDNAKIKCRTPNERFGASGAVTRLKVCANLQVLRPSERQWKPRLRQAATTLSASGGQRSGTPTKKTRTRK